MSHKSGLTFFVSSLAVFVCGFPALAVHEAGEVMRKEDAKPRAS